MRFNRKMLMGVALLTGTLATAAITAPTKSPEYIDPANYKYLPIADQAFLMYMKFNRNLVERDDVAEFIYLLRPDGKLDCDAAVIFNNEFESAKAIQNARAKANAILDSLPPTMETSFRFDLGKYDPNLGGFPVGRLEGDQRLHAASSGTITFTAWRAPPTNVGNVFQGCGAFLFNARVQILFHSDHAGSFGALQMPEAQARAYVAAHPDARIVTANVPIKITTTTEESNSWNYGAPSKIFILNGTIGNVSFLDFMTRKPIAGSMSYSSNTQ